MTVSTVNDIRTCNETKGTPDCEGCSWQGKDVYYVDTADAWLCTGCSCDWQNTINDMENLKAS